MKRWWRMIVALVALALVIESVVCQQQNDPPLNSVCGQYNATNTLEFFRNLNTTLADLRQEITVNKTYFGTQQQARTTNPVYTMFQCIKYLSTADCVSCFDKAALDIRSICKLANGARVIYDGCFLRSCPAYDGAHIILEGCFLRYEAHNFFNEYTEQDNYGVCSTNRSVSQATAFNQVVDGLLPDLVAATPKMNHVFSATPRQVFDGGATATVYAVAQCIETISKSDCQSCLTIAYNNIQNCPPAADGSAINMQCFMRYSNTSFFADNQITNIAPYLKGGDL